MQVSQIQLMADNSLSDLMRKFSQSSRPSEESVPEPKPITQIGVMEEFVSNFTDRLKSLAILPLAGSTAPCTMHIVLVTGTTGILGSHILAELLERDDVEHVYALNRSSRVPLLERQSAAFQKQRLSPALANSTKLNLICAQLGNEDLGLSPEVSDEVCRSSSETQS